MFRKVRVAARGRARRRVLAVASFCRGLANFKLVLAMELSLSHPFWLPAVQEPKRDRGLMLESWLLTTEATPGPFSQALGCYLRPSTARGQRS